MSEHIIDVIMLFSNFYGGVLKLSLILRKMVGA